jgi:DNA invertase Pin-like site-specific DNA recombinase
MSSENPSRAKLCAAIYVRMSTEHQQYSTENQTQAIEEYAAQHNLAIVKRFADYGKSGVTLAGRAALCRLLHEVGSGAAEFESILVYDVSRWGRFQDVDESAYYEYLCKKAHIRVHYCAEPFNNDGSLYSTLMKTLKRSMAAEYSRELSSKVFAGQSQLIKLGFRQGGHAGFGLRRLLLGADGKSKGILGPGERKSIQTDRVILIPGPTDEICVVQEIFDLFTVDLKSPGQIAKVLNGRGIRTDLGRAWTRNSVYQLLINPKYIGANVFNRRSCKISERSKRNPVPQWIYREDAFEPIVPLAKFTCAQELVHRRSEFLTDQQLLDRLRDLWARNGKLSAVLINADETIPAVDTYRRRFKSLNCAYGMIGYTTPRVYSEQTMGRALKERRRYLFEEIQAQLRKAGAIAEESKPARQLLVNGHFTVSIYLAPCRQQVGRANYWSILVDQSAASNLTIIARLGPGNIEKLDYFLLPELHRLTTRLFLLKESRAFDRYRFDTLDVLPTLIARQTSATGAGAVS